MQKIKINGGYTIVDDQDAHIVHNHNWKCVRANAGNNTYARRQGDSVKGKTRWICLHRVILGLTHHDGNIVDHINGNGLDNRRNNLRLCTQRQNQQNQMARTGCASKYKGVTRVKSSRHRQWQATIRHQGKKVYLGAFKTEIEAAFAYDEAARLAYGEFVRPNFPFSFENGCLQEEE